MRYVEFGQTDLIVSAICFGTWQAGGDWGTPRRRTSRPQYAGRSTSG